MDDRSLVGKEKGKGSDEEGKSQRYFGEREIPVAGKRGKKLRESQRALGDLEDRENASFHFTGISQTHTLKRHNKETACR